MMKKYLIMLGVVALGALLFVFLKPHTLVVPIQQAPTPQIPPEILKQMQADIDAEKEYLMGKFDPTTNKNFVSIPKEYTTSKTGIYIRKETYDAFLKMRIAALKDGVTLNILSGTRNFVAQKSIWESKWTTFAKSTPDGFKRFKKILEFSAAPGTSRHHWGTDIDINSVDPSYFNTTKGKKEYDWLTKNGVTFGFCQPYTAGRTTGYSEEKWHWSYVPLAKDFLQEYIQFVQPKELQGFSGAEYTQVTSLIDDYVLAINPDCR